ncbi:subtilase family protein [Paractinoplanes brasiliensis]|uniref:Subtilase family protein n=1 Tax=Paractinoplanes brasiliensis TaxID=52695 RepID=A0A4R6JVN7_9ACTN|nr:subtilase family protein [Actinoplanes brasiliensis]GID25372.1 type VII secretion-associated serine protease [Actinoplanes brasiliensis]
MPARADVWRDRQWYFPEMRLEQAQQLGKGGAGVTVAVIDTGVDTRHRDLRGATVPGWVVTRNEPSDDVDTGPHGTGIATLIAGRGHGSGRGLLGVAPRSKVMPIRPVNDDLLISNGIKWAVEHGAKVVNMSFDLESDQVLADAIAEAYANDVVLVASAGNGGGGVVEPAAFPHVIAVGSVGRDNRIASFSNRGPEVDLVTYGVSIPVARPGGKYAVSNGTSLSSALVAGGVALIRARYPDMRAEEVVDRLLSTAVDRGAGGRDDRYGEGQMDLIAALTAPRAGKSAPPSPGPARNTATASSTDDSGVPPLLIVGVGVLVFVAGLAFFMVVRTRRR